MEGWPTAAAMAVKKEKVTEPTKTSYNIVYNILPYTI